MEYFQIILISVAAFYIKGITGTGTTSIIVALGSFFIDPKLTIVLAAFINIFGGVRMVKVDPIEMPIKYWGWIAVFMVLGSIIGAFALVHTPTQAFQILLGIILLTTSILFFIQKKEQKNTGSPPNVSNSKDLIAATVSGVFSGYVGISAPPLVYYFGHYLNKRYLRRLLVLVYIPAVTIQTLVFLFNGLFTIEVLIWGLLMLPGMLFGVHLGNIAFNRISESLFRKLLGLLLIIASLRLLILGLM